MFKSTKSADSCTFEIVVLANYAIPPAFIKTKASATHLSACILQAKMRKPARVRCKR